VEKATVACGKLARDDRAKVAFWCKHLAAVTALLVRFLFTFVPGEQADFGSRAPKSTKTKTRRRGSLSGAFSSS